MFSVSLAARADTTFTLAGTFDSGAILSGDLTLNIVTGVVDSIDASYTFGTEVLNFSTVTTQRTSDGDYLLISDVFVSGDNDERFDLVFPPPLWSGIADQRYARILRGAGNTMS